MSSEPLAHDSGDVSSQDLGALLLAVSGSVPYESVDWNAFHGRLAIQAELPLARLRYPRVGGDRVVAVVRPTTPIPIRRVVLVTVIRRTPKESVDAATQVVASATTSDAGGTRAAFESAVVGGAHASRIETVLMPSAAELLIPLGDGVAQ